MLRAIHPVVNTGLNIFWRARPSRRHINSPLQDENLVLSEDRACLRGIIQRFPYWQRGRLLLAEASLRADDIATAYAEAQALRVLAPQGGPLHAASLGLLGRCYLRRGDASSALHLLNEASQMRPHDYPILEERAAAYALLGERSQALELLKTIPQHQLSAEGRAAMQWLGEKGNDSKAPHGRS